MPTYARRDFLKNSVLVGAAAAIALPSVGQSALSSPAERIRVAVVGLGGRGRESHCTALMQMENQNVEIAALCDCDESRLQNGAKKVSEQTGKTPALFTDYRKLLEDKSIDAVSLATPNHWHALQTIWACQAGKDVYVEKPGSHNIYEGRKMVQAARKYKRIVQHGTQIRSSPKIREGVEQLKAGVIGTVYMARGIAFKTRSGMARVPKPVPKELNWDLWVGPAAMEDYTELAVYRWRFVRNFGNGEIGDQGVHQLDLIRWGLSIDTHPTKVQSMGGRLAFPNEGEDSPGSQVFACQYADRNVLVSFETRDWYTNAEAGMGIEHPFVDHRNVVGAIFFGAKGYMIFPDYSSYFTYLGANRKPGPSASVAGNPFMDLEHFQNWIAAVRSRDASQLNAEIEQGHLSACLPHLANIAYATGRTLTFDPATETLQGDAEANALLTRKYREPYVLPTEV